MPLFTQIFVTLSSFRSHSSLLLFIIPMAHVCAQKHPPMYFYKSKSLVNRTRLLVQLFIIFQINNTCTTIRLRGLSLLNHAARQGTRVKALDLALKTKNGVLPNPGWRRPGVVHDAHGFTALKKTSLLLST